MKGKKCTETVGRVAVSKIPSPGGVIDLNGKLRWGEPGRDYTH